MLLVMLLQMHTKKNIYQKYNHTKQHMNVLKCRCPWSCTNLSMYSCIVLPRMPLELLQHLILCMWVYEWVLMWVAQQQLLHSKQRWIYSLINKSGWMSMQMDMRTTVPNVTFAWKPSSPHKLDGFHRPSCFIELSNANNKKNCSCTEQDMLLQQKSSSETKSYILWGHIWECLEKRFLQR